MSVSKKPRSILELQTELIVYVGVYLQLKEATMYLQTQCFYLPPSIASVLLKFSFNQPPFIHEPCFGGSGIVVCGEE